MCSVFDVELWGTLDGLTLLQDRDLNKILIQMDNLEHWVVRHVPREVNLVVDRIAKMVFVDLEGVNVLATTPTDLLEALESDGATGVFFILSV
ncbi:hypothetical protein Gohar_008445 [Gossypium harknessii]|uniref:RNase H type-1 domain-containing protein n=1 Tax=Gossypium harknessii TaxID=34285 RepID=A0A7J9GJN7_9ROSI|nr:hypothetical protein [Gossypium harknessii]